MADPVRRASDWRPANHPADCQMADGRRTRRWTHDRDAGGDAAGRNEIWQAVATVADQDGIHDLFPKTAKEWLDMRRAAVRIMEGGNLLMMPDREAAPVGTKSKTPGVELEPAQINALIEKNRQSFNAFARALRNLGLEALRASDDKNAALLLEIADRMQPVCAGCHHTFWYPLQSR